MADHLKEENVFLFVPNIIGYVRIALLLLSVWSMPTDYIRTSSYYIISQLLDAVDGYAARYLNQSSRLGAMLDQLTDRCSTLVLLVILGQFYPNFCMLFQISAAVDIASHWLHLHASDIRGGDHYKRVEVTNALSHLLHFYYTSRPFLFFMCAGNELFYCSLYLYHFSPGPQLFGIGLWAVTASLCFPVALLKSAISMVHLVQAASNIAEVDVAERRALAERAAR